MSPASRATARHPDQDSNHALDQPKDQVWDQVFDRIFLLGLLGAVVFVLWLPVFPTGDGPVHLYYADVLWSLVCHQSAYAPDYAIRHLFAPYLVHYLALVSFEHFVSPPMAEKWFIAIIFVTQAFGFRFLARRLGGEAAGSSLAHGASLKPVACLAPVACIWMLPLLFSWSLGGGFLNCCFATGILLWSLGVWTLLGTDDRLCNGPAPGARLVSLLAAHAGLLAVLVLSHPVPLMVLLLFTASDLFLRLLSPPAGGLRWKPFAPQVGAFAMTCWAFLFPVLLAQKGQAAAVLPGIGFHRDVLVELLLGMRLGYFAGLNLHSLSGWLSIASRAALIAIVPGVVILLLSHGARRLLASPAARLLLICIVFLAATVFFPRSLNHSYFFPQRMWDIVWLLVLACAAAATPSARTRRGLAAGGLALIVITAVTGLPALTRIARAQQQLASAPLPAGRYGLFLEPDSAEEGRGAATTYPVYSWAGARAFEASHAILLNSPWLGLTILPVRNGAVPGLSHLLIDMDDLPSTYSESPIALTDAFKNPPPDRETILARVKILAHAEFFLYSNPASLGSPDAAEQTRRAALALVGNDSAAWQCTATGFYAVCRRAR
jgi:hypothetical protein